MTKQVLLIESSAKLASIYGLNLNAYLGLETYHYPSAQVAIEEYLSKKPTTLVLIVTRVHCKTQLKNDEKKEETAKILLQYCQQNNLAVPLMVIGKMTGLEEKMKLPSEMMMNMPNGVDLKSIIKNCAKFINITAKEMAAKVVPPFYPIPLHHFEQINSSLCDIYLNRNITQSQPYELVFSAGTDFPPSRLQHIKDQGLSELYVDKDLRLKFVNHATMEMINKLTNQDLTLEDQIAAGQLTMETLISKINEIGITHEVISLADSSMKNIVNTAKETATLKSLFRALLENKASYMFKHTQVLTYVMIHLVKNLDWGKMDLEEKMVFMAVFHDIVLTKDEMCKIRSQEELEKSSLSAKEKDLVLHHALRGAELLKHYPRTPHGMEPILKQHHGMLNGVGFAQNCSMNLAPPAIAFMVAEEYTDYIIEHQQEKINKKEVIERLLKKYPTQRFKKIIDVLEQVTN